MLSGRISHGRSPSGASFYSYRHMGVGLFLIVLCFFVLTLNFLIPSQLHAASATLTWNGSGSRVHGYQIYYGLSHGSYNYSQDVGNTTTYTLSGLNTGQIYYLAVTAYNYAYIESGFSNEIAIQISQSGQVTASPSIPQLISPTGSTADPTPTFSWGNVKGAEQYALWIYDSSGNTVFSKWYMADDIVSGNTCYATISQSLSNGYYSWKVRAWNSLGYGNWSESASFNVSAAGPGQASLISPSGVITGNAPDFTWNAVSNTEQYCLWIFDLSGNTVFSNWYSASEITSNALCEVNSPITMTNGSYFWQIRTWNSDGFGAWGLPMSFAIRSLVPATPTLISPSGNISDTTPEFRWNSVNSANQYLLLIEDAAQNTVLRQWYTASDVTSGSVCSVTSGVSLSSDSYKWWVRAWNSSGYSNWSEGMSFTVAGQVPSSTGLVSPQGIISNSSPTYTWTTISSAEQYCLLVWDSAGNVVHNTWYHASEVTNGSNCSVTPATSLSNGDYDWWVRTWNSNGYGSWSEKMSFTVQANSDTGDVVLAINAGGDDFIGVDGVHYWADNYFLDGGTYSTTVSINRTEDDYIYQSERYNDFSYAIPIADGDYLVTLKFAEIYHSSSGARIFDVDIEDQQVIDNLDVAYAAGSVNTAYDVSFPTTVEDGTLNIDFYNRRNNAMISALVVRQGTIPLPAPEAYGYIVGSDQSHPDAVNYFFEGMRGDVKIHYEVYDIDYLNEVEIYINGNYVTAPSATSNGGWSGTRTLVIPDSMVKNYSTNICFYSARLTIQGTPVIGEYVMFRLGKRDI